jgi:hypothetical protein
VAQEERLKQPREAAEERHQAHDPGGAE